MSDEKVERWIEPWPLDVREAAERHGCQDETVVPLSDAEAALARVEEEREQWRIKANGLADKLKAQPVEESARLVAALLERDQALARAEKAEAERDEARFRRIPLDEALSRIEAVREEVEKWWRDAHFFSGQEDYARQLQERDKRVLSLLDKKETP